MKENFVTFVNAKLEKDFESLIDAKHEDRKLYYFLERAIQDLKKNPAIGIKIPKKLWPKEYLKEYRITNLWKYNLPDAWRLIYTIKEDDVMILSIILEWFSHNEYEKKFRY